ncbi:hypothetical protein Tco_1521564, partial [Tanacetum coccineum]
MNQGRKQKNGKIILWKDLQLAKCLTNGISWAIMGDFNVTLKLEEHSASSSVISCEMQEFIDCVNWIEVEDVFFHPFMISDHSSAILIIPNTMAKKKKSFKFAILVTKKLKLLKKHIKKLQWMNGDIFARVEILRSKLKNAQSDV